MGGKLKPTSYMKTGDSFTDMKKQEVGIGCGNELQGHGRTVRRVQRVHLINCHAKLAWDEAVPGQDRSHRNIISISNIHSCLMKLNHLFVSLLCGSLLG